MPSVDLSSVRNQLPAPPPLPYQEQPWLYVRGGGIGFTEISLTAIVVFVSLPLMNGELQTKIRTLRAFQSKVQKIRQKVKFFSFFGADHE
jgi:membrane protein insertase Oxa1/YidC/SpoIIIJ